MENIFISIVIPCFNEERNLRLGVLEKVSTFMKRKHFNWEVILVDDGSKDESRKLIKNFIAEDPHFLLIEAQHQGKAATVITGINKARGKVVLFTDLDQATPISELDNLLPFIDKGYDIVIGSRNNKRRGAPLMRLAIAKGFMMLRNLILNLDIKDTQCGFKLFNRSKTHQIFQKLKLYKTPKNVAGAKVTAGFDVEILYIAKSLGLKIKEVPVEWHYQETRHVNIVKDSIEGLKDLLAIRLNSLRGVYG